METRTCLISPDLCGGPVHALVTPPFQASDEPNHFLGFAFLTKQPELVSETYALARVGHMNHSGLTRHNSCGPTTSTPSTGRLDVAIPHPNGQGLPGSARLRIHPVGTLRAGAALLTAQSACSGRRWQSASWSWRFDRGHRQFHRYAGADARPMVPFLAMAFSNHAWLVGGYILLARAATAMLLDSDQDSAAGCTLSAGIIIVVLGGLSAWPFAPMVLAIIAAARTRAPTGEAGTGSLLDSVAAVVPLTFVLRARLRQDVDAECRLPYPALMAPLVVRRGGIAVRWSGGYTPLCGCATPCRGPRPASRGASRSSSRSQS